MVCLKVPIQKLIVIKTLQIIKVPQKAQIPRTKITLLRATTSKLILQMAAIIILKMTKAYCKIQTLKTVRAVLNLTVILQMHEATPKLLILSLKINMTLLEVTKMIFPMLKFSHKALALQIITTLGKATTNNFLIMGV